MISSQNVSSADPRDEQHITATSTAVVGLSNLGNTCFFNSSVQLLLSCAPLQQMLLQHEHHIAKGPLGYALQQAAMFANGECWLSPATAQQSCSHSVSAELATFQALPQEQHVTPCWQQASAAAVVCSACSQDSLCISIAAVVAGKRALQHEACLQERKVSQTGSRPVHPIHPISLDYTPQALQDTISSCICFSQAS